MKSHICVQNIYQCWVVKHSSFIRSIHEWFFHLHAICSTFINDQVAEQSFHLKHSLLIRSISEQFFHLHEYYSTSVKLSCQTLSVHQINLWVNLSFTCKCSTFINAELSNTAHSSNQFWANLLFTCIMRHICQSWVVKHSSFIESISRHDEGVIFTATPCNCSSFIKSILKEFLHLYMTHLTMLSFSNKALLFKQFQDIMKMLFKPEQQCNYNCSW